MIRSPRVPAPLLYLLAAVAVIGVAWALVSPPFQAPDEPAHYAYVESIAERGELPGDGESPFSTAQLAAMQASDAVPTAGNLFGRPPWDEEAKRRWETVAQGLGEEERSDGGGDNPASFNPPLYYLYELPPYLAGGDVLDRLVLMRLWSVLLLLAATAATWLLAGEVFGRRRLLQLVAAAAVGLQPMVAFVSGTVNPDALMFALWAVVLWLGARLLRRGLRPAEAAWLVAATALAMAAKGVSVALVPGVLLVLAVSARGTLASRPDRARMARVGAVLVGGAALAAGAVTVIAGGSLLPGQVSVALPEGGSVRELLSYVWQFYLPRLPFQNDIGVGDSAWYDVWIVKGWGAFGWLEVRLPEVVYPVLAAATGVALIGGLVALWRRWEPNRAVAAFFALVALSLLAGLHWTEYRELQLEERLLVQGRYLLPLAPLGGVALAAALTLLPARRQAVAAGVALGGLAVLQSLALGVTMERFYA